MVKKEDKKESKNVKLEKKITYERKSAWDSFKSKTKIFDLSDKYKEFMSKSKNERFCTKEIIKILKNKGFNDIKTVKSAKKGDKLYKIFKEKVVIAFVVGEDKEEFRLIGSHTDSPRLDIKPFPMYEDSGICMMKSHYYGGIKKYQWVNTPLILSGVVHTKNGKKLEIEIGQNSDEPKFLIPDLLPHLAKNQMERKANEIVGGEELNIVIGNMPVDDENVKSKVKFTILEKLNKDYGIVEDDFTFAELEFVPYFVPSDIGIDKSMVGAYGQDDKVCVFSSLMALTDIKNPKKTAIGFFVDKEEIGSVGDTGAASLVLKNFAEEYVDLLKLKVLPSKIFQASKSISADVTSGINPNYADVQDPRNASFIGNGVSFEKYGGGGGKGYTNDASAEYMNFIRQILEKNKIPWQTGENGKIDVGGGGTIAMFLSKYGMDCLDAGPCILAMHSTCEITSKVDIYCAYLLYKAFMES